MVLLGVPPTLLLIVALWIGRREEGIFGLRALTVSALVAAGGPLWWSLARARHARRRITSQMAAWRRGTRAA